MEEKHKTGRAWSPALPPEPEPEPEPSRDGATLTDEHAGMCERSGA